MKIENVDIIKMALLFVFVVLMLAFVVCVLTDNIVAALIIFAAAIAISAVLSTNTIDYIIIEYYYSEESELV